MLNGFINSTLRGLAISCVSPILLSHWLSSLVTNADSSLESHSQLLSLLPGRSGNYLRVAFYRFALDQCDPTATICFGTLFSKTGARIDKHVYIGPRCMLGLVTLEEDVLLGPAVQIPSGPMTHGIERLDTPIRLQPGVLRRITVGRDSWIGAKAVLLESVSEQSIVGAGSILTKKFAPRSILAGSPARSVSDRNPRPHVSNTSSHLN